MKIRFLIKNKVNFSLICQESNVVRLLLQFEFIPLENTNSDNIKLDECVGKDCCVYKRFNFQSIFYFENFI